jgi:peptide/nickel transport system substrate-binding protein
VDSLIDAVRTEPDPARRREQVGEVLEQVHEDVAFIPILRPSLSWAVRKGVRVTQWPSNMVEARFVKIQQPKH